MVRGVALVLSARASLVRGSVHRRGRILALTSKDCCVSLVGRSLAGQRWTNMDVTGLAATYMSYYVTFL